MARSDLIDDESDLAQSELRRVAALDEIGASLETMKEEAVRWRSEFELEWTQDFQQYNTSARALGPTKREGAPPPVQGEAAYRQTADNITRPKVIITASRLGDMLFPTNEANWALDISPRPEVPDELIPPPAPGPQGEPPQPYTPEQMLEVKKVVARKACTAMSDTIRDQLSECHYDETGRQAIFDACLYGTGVIRGPVLKNRRYHTMGGYGQMTQSAYPCAEYVDLWQFFPQPSRSIDECEHVFRLHILPKRGVRQLARQPAFDQVQIQRLLGREPEPGALITAALDRGAVRPDATVVLRDRYTVWEYRGPMPKDAFRAYLDGLVMQGVVEASAHESLLRELERDHLHEIDCEVWFSQGIVLKMALSTLGPGELGYYIYNYEKNPNSIFGRGVAFLCRDDQHATNQLWHAMMLNSMMSAGPQIGVRKGSLVAQPGEGRATSLAADKPKVWALNDDIEDINKALSVFIIPNVTDKILGLYERSKANADEHTMIPMIAQGEPTSAVPTSSGTAMLLNAANVVMRRLAKAWDDGITVPLIEAWVEWNMANNPDPDIRGDHYVCPKGASHLLIKDVQTQHLQFATQLFTANPLLAPYMKAGVFARKNIEMLDLTADELLYSDQQVADMQAAQGEQPDPELLKAQAQQATAEAALKRAEADQAMAQHKMQFDREQMALNHEQRMADIQARERIQAMQLQGTKLNILQAMSQMESDERLGMQKLIAELTKHGAALDLQQFDVEMRGRIEAEKIAAGERKVDKEIAVEKEPKIQ